MLLKVKAGILAAAFSVVFVGPLGASPLETPKAQEVKRTVVKVRQENPYMQECLNRCAMENAIRWQACSANGATNPSVEACRNVSYQLYSACVTGCYSG